MKIHSRHCHKTDGGAGAGVGGVGHPHPPCQLAVTFVLLYLESHGRKKTAGKYEQFTVFSKEVYMKARRENCVISLVVSALELITL